MAYDALFERSVVLRTAENIGHDLAENGAAAEELHHARGDGGTEECATVKAAHDARGEFEFVGEGRAKPVGVHLGIAFGDGFAEKFAGAHGVEQSFTSEGIDKSGRIADERPIFADDRALRKCRNLWRGKNMAVEARGFGGKFLLADKRLQVSAKFVLIVRGHAAADADG